MYFLFINILLISVSNNLFCSDAWTIIKTKKIQSPGDRSCLTRAVQAALYMQNFFNNSNSKFDNLQNYIEEQEQLNNDLTSYDKQNYATISSDFLHYLPLLKERNRVARAPIFFLQFENEKTAAEPFVGFFLQKRGEEQWSYLFGKTTENYYVHSKEILDWYYEIFKEKKTNNTVFSYGSDYIDFFNAFLRLKNKEINSLIVLTSVMGGRRHAACVGITMENEKLKFFQYDTLNEAYYQDKFKALQNNFYNIVASITSNDIDRCKEVMDDICKNSVKKIKESLNTLINSDVEHNEYRYYYEKLKDKNIEVSEQTKEERLRIFYQKAKKNLYVDSNKECKDRYEIPEIKDWNDNIFDIGSYVFKSIMALMTHKDKYVNLQEIYFDRENSDHWFFQIKDETAWNSHVYFFERHMLDYLFNENKNNDDFFNHASYMEQWRYYIEFLRFRKRDKKKPYYIIVCDGLENNVLEGFYKAGEIGNITQEPPVNIVIDKSYKNPSGLNENPIKQNVSKDNKNTSIKNFIKNHYIKLFLIFCFFVGCKYKAHIVMHQIKTFFNLSKFFD